MLKERVNQDEQLIVVVSAMGNTTDQLMTNVSTPWFKHQNNKN